MSELMQFFLMVTAILLWFPTLGIFYNISAYIGEKRKLAKQQEKTLREKTEKNILQKLDTTERILGFITSLIQIEVNSKLTPLNLLGVNYNILNLDNDVKEIGKKVFNAVKKENGIFDASLSLVSDEYLMSYITAYSTIILTTSMKEYNMALYIDNNQ